MTAPSDIITTTYTLPVNNNNNNNGPASSTVITTLARSNESALKSSLAAITTSQAATSAIASSIAPSPSISSSGANSPAPSITTVLPSGISTFATCPESTLPPGLSCFWPSSDIVQTFSPTTSTITTNVQNVPSTYVEISWALQEQPATNPIGSGTRTTSAVTALTSSASAIPSAKSSSHKDNGISTATLAGAAVGCLIAGALFAGLIAFFILRKRSQRNKHVQRDTYVPTSSPAYGGEKGTPMVSIAPVPNMDFLPQQADDAEVKRKLSTVIDQIDQHVENFYGNRGAPIDPEWEAEISRFDTNELPLPLVACFQNSAAPTTLIKHCLAYYIFNLTVSPNEHRTSLLPSEMAGMVAAMYHRTLSSAATKDNITAFSNWKSLTRYLRPDLGRDSATAKTTTDSSARVATHFTNIFSPWAHTHYSGDARARHLTDVINQAVQTAIWLFGQPDNYRFEWDVPNTRQDTNYSAVVVPAVWKTTHNGTKLSNKGQNILPPVIKGF